MKENVSESEQPPPRATIVIPAHNEANVIQRCLEHIYDTSEPGEFEVIVVCNGCTDNTAGVVRQNFPLARILETPVASKVYSLNLADVTSSCFPRIYLDADLAVNADSLRSLIEPLVKGEAQASCGRMEIDTRRSGILVKAFYQVWQENSYLEDGKFGGLFAVSETGHRRISPFINVTNDDELVRRQFKKSERYFASNCVFRMTAPRTLGGLVKIRTRAIRGTIELAKLGLNDNSGSSISKFGRFLGRISRKPSLWVSLPFYLMISVFVRVKIALYNPKNPALWERDDTSREVA